jgi:hypothetical protein
VTLTLVPPVSLPRRWGLLGHRAAGPSSAFSSQGGGGHHAAGPQARTTAGFSPWVFPLPQGRCGVGGCRPHPSQPPGHSRTTPCAHSVSARGGRCGRSSQDAPRNTDTQAARGGKPPGWPVALGSVPLLWFTGLCISPDCIGGSSVLHHGVSQDIHHGRRGAHTQAPGLLGSALFQTGGPVRAGPVLRPAPAATGSSPRDGRRWADPHRGRDTGDEARHPGAPGRCDGGARIRVCGGVFRAGDTDRSRTDPGPHRDDTVVRQ